MIILNSANNSNQTREVNDMAKDYSVQGTTKLQREKYADEALALSTLDAPAPSVETMNLMREHIDGRREISEIVHLTIDRHRAKPSHA